MPVPGFVYGVQRNRRRLEWINGVGRRNRRRRMAQRRDDRHEIGVGDRLAVVGDRHQRAVDLPDFRR
jgi:hypothetical protein